MSKERQKRMLAEQEGNKMKEPAQQGDLLITSGEWAGGITWDFFSCQSNREMPELSLCTAAFCVVTYQGKLLIVEHANRGFELPGGHVDPEEQLSLTVQREVLEEVGARILSPEYFGYKRVSPPKPIPHRDDPTKYYPFPHSFVPYFVAEAVELFDIPLASDVKGTKLVTFEEAAQLFAPGHNHDKIVRQALIYKGAQGV